MEMDLTKGPILKTMLWFSNPLILGDLLQQCYNIAGTIIVGQLLGANACDHLHTALYTRMFELLGTCASERLITGDSTKSVMKFSKPEVLVIDDFANTSLSETEAIDLFKIMGYRYGNRSTIIASQLEPKEWHKRIPNGILADSILDRIISNSYKLILSGDSRRPKNNTL